MGIFKIIKSIFCKPKQESILEGVIKFFDRKKRFGFIVSGKNEYFFHATSIKHEDFRSIRDGRSVRFSIKESKKGKQAVKIQLM